MKRRNFFTLILAGFSSLFLSPKILNTKNRKTLFFGERETKLIDSIQKEYYGILVQQSIFYVDKNDNLKLKKIYASIKINDIKNIDIEFPINANVNEKFNIEVGDSIYFDETLYKINAITKRYDGRILTIKGKLDEKNDKAIC